MIKLSQDKLFVPSIPIPGGLKAVIGGIDAHLAQIFPITPNSEPLPRFHQIIIIISFFIHITSI
jgi:hypothetical protein